MNIHLAGVIRLMDGVELDDGFNLHRKIKIRLAPARETAAAEWIGGCGLRAV
jgi:hypothetical protein